MARPRFNGQGFTNPINPLGLNAESRHRVNPNLSGAFMSNETHFAETVNGNQVFNVATALARGGAKAGAKASAKASAKAAARAAAKAAAKASKKALQASTKAIGKGLNSPIAKRGLTVGIAGATVYYTLAGEMGLGTQFMDDLSGLNCDEKVKDAGYEEGTDEYTKAVEECQESAGEKLMYLGYGSVAIVGALILMFALKRPKKSDDSEE